jgi:hypothetical protein
VPVGFDQEILLVTYYEIIEEQIGEDITDKESSYAVIEMHLFLRSVIPETQYL